MERKVENPKEHANKIFDKISKLIKQMQRKEMTYTQFVGSLLTNDPMEQMFLPNIRKIKLLVQGEYHLSPSFEDLQFFFPSKN